jgi:hypothetical protein
VSGPFLAGIPAVRPMTGERFVDLSGPDADISEPVG